MLIAYDSDGIPIDRSEAISGNHNDAFEPIENFEDMIEFFKKSNICVDVFALKMTLVLIQLNFVILFSNMKF
jgi:hypothetical protein